MTAKASLLIIFLILVTGCSSMRFKEKIFTNMLLAGSVGYLAGQSKKNHKDEFSIMYFGLGASVAAVGTVLVEDPDRKNIQLTDDLKKIEAKYDELFNPKTEIATSGMMNSKVPNKYKSMINPGEWRVYSMDQWIEDGDNKLIHQDKMMELIPPSLKPAQLPIKKGHEQ